MKATADLFNLVHSLTKNEKSYISFSIIHQGEKNYLKLFQAIAKQSDFNEAELRNVLRKEKFIARLPYLKHYLQEYILKKLNSFRYNRDKESVFHQSLLEIDILIEKNLHQYANKKLRKIKKLAGKQEDFEIILFCIKKEKKLLQSVHYSTTQSDWNKLLHQEISLTKRIDNLNMYEALSAKLTIFFYTTGDYIRNKSQKEKIHKWLKHPLLKNEIKPLSNAAKLHYYNIRALCCNFLQEYQNALKNIEAILLILEPSIYTQTFSTTRHLSYLNNKALLQIKLKNYAAAFLTLEQIRANIKIYSKNIFLPEESIQRISASSYLHELNLLVKSGQFKRAIEIIPHAEQMIKKYSEIIGEEILMVFYYQFSYIHFIWGNYRQTIVQLHKILNHKKQGNELREDIYCLSRILYMLTHYEIEKENLGENTIKFTYEFLVRNKRLYKTETIFLDFIRKNLLKNQERIKLIQEFRKLKEAITLLKEDMYEKNILEDFDFISWIESKISKKSFLEVLTKKHE